MLLSNGKRSEGNYSQLQQIENSKLFKFQTGLPLWGIMDENGKILQPPLFSEINATQNKDLIIIEQNSHWGLMNDKGEIIAPCNYSAISINASDTILAEIKRRTWNILNLHGKQILNNSYSYDNIDVLSNGFLVVTDHNKQGIISLNKTVYLPIEMDKIQLINNAFVCQYKNDSFTLTVVNNNLVCISGNQHLYNKIIDSFLKSFY